MILDWGMSEKFRHMALGEESKNVFLGEELAHGRNYSETTAREIDEEVRAILEDAYHRSAKALEKHREQMDEIVEILLKNEEIPGDKVLEVLGVKNGETGSDQPEDGAGQSGTDQSAREDQS
jgi:cell division protease FtsH